ncbi:MAG: Crp/Fnr family transcriptional regulator [Firmicutes bacterium]|nr:Crp/Fnr family transcriptional regulator [Bacillota bacterium]
MLGCLQAQVVRVPRGKAILEEGQPAEKMGILLSGSANIVQEDYYGNRTLVAGIEPAELFAESLAGAGVKEMPLSVVAAEDCEVMLIDCMRILRTCSNSCIFHTSLINNLLQVIAAKNLKLNQKIQIISRRTTREKLMAYLMMQAKNRGSSEFTIPFDRQELADFLGVERSAMSAEISKLRAEGIIECNRSWFRLL